MNIILFESIPNGFIPIDDRRAEHILSVLRLKTGDSFKLGRINGEAGIATIGEISPEGIKFSFERTQENASGLYPVTLVVAQVRPICMKRILREAVSLGVGRIIVTGAETAEKSYGESDLWKKDEFREILLDGAMQSAATGIPPLELYPSVKLSLANLGDSYKDRLLLDNIDGAEPLSQSETALPAVAAIGPERGWSERERSMFAAAGFRPMSLGKRVLRTETAVPAALSLLFARADLI